ncbi:MAG: hypothetical protein WBF55_06020 [Syntrophobacteria bacterium]
MSIIQKEEIIARRNETGRRIKCKKCMNDRDFQQMAKNELLLRATVEQLYSKGNIIFCDACNINLYSFIFELEEKKLEETSVSPSSEGEINPEEFPVPPLPEVKTNPEEAPVPSLPEVEINPEEFPMHLYPPESSVFGKEDQKES